MADACEEERGKTSAEASRRRCARRVSLTQLFSCAPSVLCRENVISREKRVLFIVSSVVAGERG